jgi:TatD DNase family protein
MELIDTHCHLDFTQFADDHLHVIDNARRRGVQRFVIPAVKQASWQRLIDFCKIQQGLYYALGLHPMFFSEHKYEHLSLLKKSIQNSQAIAVGEIGLDFYQSEVDHEMQLEFFEQQLLIAQDLDLPVILHVRKAHEETIAWLQKIKVPGGIVHAFNGSLQQAERYRRLNFKFGFGGMLTYERSSKLRLLAKQLPLESIVLETDAPDMTVAQHRGERNSPEYLPFCLQALAQVRDEEIDVLAKATTHNAYHVLRIKD